MLKSLTARMEEKKKDDTAQRISAFEKNLKEEIREYGSSFFMIVTEKQTRFGGGIESGVVMLVKANSFESIDDGYLISGGYSTAEINFLKKDSIPLEEPQIGNTIIGGPKLTLREKDLQKDFYFGDSIKKYLNDKNLRDAFVVLYHHLEKCG